MIRECPRDRLTELESDLAGEYPWYLYVTSDKRTVLYSRSIVELLADHRVPKPVKVSEEGVSFLLQSGVVPPPKTVYQNIFNVGIGIKVEVHSINDRFEVEFSRSFPFSNNMRQPSGSQAPDETLILELLANATAKGIDESRPSFLFHSAGKDSNTIALALAEAGWQNKVTLVTQRSLGVADESIICRDIAKRLGFQHVTLEPSSEVKKWPEKHIHQYFEAAPFPCTDNVSIAYPLYALQCNQLRGANVIDGSGNDVHMGYIPPTAEYKKQIYAEFLKILRPVAKQLGSTSLLHAVVKSRVEHTGLSGFSERDALKIYPPFEDLKPNWALLDDGRDYLDLRALVRGGIVEPECFQRKVKNFCDVYSSNLVLPWSAVPVAQYFSILPEEYLFDRNILKNKLVLRKMLKSKVGLDSDAIGKRGYGFDRSDIVERRWTWVLQSIVDCPLWRPAGVEELTDQLKRISERKGRPAQVANSLIHRLLLISLWYSNNRYIR